MTTEAQYLFDERLKLRRVDRRLTTRRLDRREAFIPPGPRSCIPLYYADSARGASRSATRQRCARASPARPSSRTSTTSSSSPAP